MERVYTIFISSSEEDSLFKQIIENQLKKISDLTIINRTTGINNVKETIIFAHFFLALLTKKGFKDENLLSEIDVAKSMNKRIIAVVENSDQIAQIQDLVPESEFLVYESSEPLSVLNKLYATVNRLMQREPMLQEQLQAQSQIVITKAREERNLERLILSKMSESRLKTFTSFDLAIDTGAPLNDIRNLITNLERNDLVRRLEGGYYSITYKGLDRVRGRSRMYEQR